MNGPRFSLLVAVAMVICPEVSPQKAAPAPHCLEALEGATPRSIVFILSDAHRYDVMGLMGHPFVETPHMDALAREGAHLKNAFVTTSLCSPSRASILTGQFVHSHQVVDNNDLAPRGTVFFPQYLQSSGYETAFVGKWHMGGQSDAARPGFDHWISFRGQGTYYPPTNRKWRLNVNGKKVPQKGYITDELTDYAIEWLGGRSQQKPFFLFLSHKAVHHNFEPAERHKGRYAKVEIQPPVTMADTEENYRGKPLWVRNQRNSWHGVDFPYHSDTDMEKLYRDYCESLLAVDDSIGRVMDWLRKEKLADSTLVLYMGDNGFLWGEHGLIDKRNAYEESMRVPMLARCPDLIQPNTVVEGVVANIDIGPTFLEVAGLQTPDSMDGKSMVGLLSGKTKLKQWRDQLLYEYYWEYNFPHTPTVFALRGNRYKFIQYHGVWDIDELYDLKEDPKERNNLIFHPDHAARVRALRQRLHEELEATGGTTVPFGMKKSHGASLRRRSGAKPAAFPPEFMRDESSKK